jgi:hypothetical protein
MEAKQMEEQFWGEGQTELCVAIQPTAPNNTRRTHEGLRPLGRFPHRRDQCLHHIVVVVNKNSSAVSATIIINE